MQRLLTTTEQLPVVLSVVGVAFIALGLSKVPSTGSAVAVVAIVGLLPVAVLAPSRWRGRISERCYLREAGTLTPGVALYALIAAINPDWATALVLGAASAYLLIAGRAPWRRSRLQPRWLVVTVGSCAIAGLLADLPSPLGWNTLAYSCFGAAALATLTAARTSGAD